MIGVGGYCLKIVPVLLSYPVPGPLATESWLFLKAIFLSVLIDIPSLVASLLLILGCIKCSSLPLSAVLFSVFSFTYSQPQSENIK